MMTLMSITLNCQTQKVQTIQRTKNEYCVEDKPCHDDIKFDDIGSLKLESLNDPNKKKYFHVKETPCHNNINVNNIGLLKLESLNSSNKN